MVCFVSFISQPTRTTAFITPPTCNERMRTGSLVPQASQTKREGVSAEGCAKGTHQMATGGGKRSGDALDSDDDDESDS